MDRPQRILVTGGAGFIGSAVVRRLVGQGYHVINLDKVTYSGNPDSLRAVSGVPNYRFHQADICDQKRVAGILEDLAWLGLRWDALAFQSERLAKYQAALETLKARGLVYPCFCTRKEVEAGVFDGVGAVPALPGRAELGELMFSLLRG